MFFFSIFLQKMTDEEETEKEKRIQRIKTLFAFDLFSQHRFEESLQTFATLGTGKWWLNCVVKSILFPDHWLLVKCIHKYKLW